VLLFCEIYHTVKTGIFDRNHLILLIVYAGMLFGFIKFAEVIAYFTRQPAPQDSKESTPSDTKKEPI